MQRIIVFIISMISISIFSNCNNTRMVTEKSKPATGGSEMLYSSKWELVSLDGVTNIPTTGKKPFLGFYPGNVNTIKGNTGCNNLNGSFELLDNHAIKFSPLATTKMACVGENIEPAFVSAVAKASTWSIADNVLTLSADGKMLAKFAAAATDNTVPNAEKLVGKWELNYVSGSKVAFDKLYPEKKPYVLFNVKTNELSGSTSCNGFTSKITMDGNKISIGEPLKTMIFCEGGGENAFTDLFKKINGYAISGDGNTLNFLTGDIAVMRFFKKEKN